MDSAYRGCRLCPRLCGVDRTSGQRGFCCQSDAIRLAWAGLHFGEEPPVTGTGGSGAIFFSGCTLGCPYCQNEQLSRHRMGRAISEAELAGIMLRLQERGAENLNLVTGTQFVPGIVRAVMDAREQGLSLPVLWNSSGYERLETLEALQEIVDVYLPDCKTVDEELSARLLGVADYPRVAREALACMVAAKPLLLVREGETVRILRGVIVRHLVLPGLLESTRRVLRWFSGTLQGQALLSIMFQYTPNGRAASPGRGGVSRRRLFPPEIRRVTEWLEALEIEEGFVQEAAEEDLWLPDFRRKNPFPPGQAVPVWHWRSNAPN
jgi:putative pyruvate formate lyase activating enzyme